MEKQNLKDTILKNIFADKLRIEMKFDDAEYTRLCESLKELAIQIKCEKYIDKELMVTLYCIPQMVRNIFLDFSTCNESNEKFIMKLEDAWVDLDGLVLEILS